MLDLNDYGRENNRGKRYVLLVNDNFSKFAWTIGLKNKNSQSIKDVFENILKTSERKSNLIETDSVKEFYNRIFQNFRNNNNYKLYSRITSLGAVFAERFNRTIRNLLGRPVFEKRDASWIDVLPISTKQ